MMDRDVADALKLDEAYKSQLNAMRPYVTELPSPKEVSLCRAWLERLHWTAPHERLLRNAYLRLMISQLQRGSFGMPFDRMPPCDCPLPQLSHSVSVIKEKRDLCSSSWSDISETTDTVGTCSDNSRHQRWSGSSPHSTSQTALCGPRLHLPTRLSAPPLPPATTASIQTPPTSPPAAHHCTRLRDLPKRRYAALHQATISQQSVGDETTSELDISRLNKPRRSQVTMVTSLRRSRKEMRVLKLKGLVAHLQTQKVSLMHEISLYEKGSRRDQESLTLLRSEVTALKEKLSEMQSSKSQLELNHNETVVNLHRETQETLDGMTHALNTARNKVGRLEADMATYRLAVDELEARQRDQLVGLKRQWEGKIKALDAELRNGLTELQRKTNTDIQKYETDIEKCEAENRKLRSQAIKKDAEISRLEALVADQCRHLQTEVGEIRSEMETNTRLSEQHLRARLEDERQRALIRMNRANKKAAQEYETRLSALRKQKDLEIRTLSVQLLAHRSELENSDHKEAEIEKKVSCLEQRYRTLVANAEEKVRQQYGEFREKVKSAEELPTIQ